VDQASAVAYAAPSKRPARAEKANNVKTPERRLPDTPSPRADAAAPPPDAEVAKEVDQKSDQSSRASHTQEESEVPTAGAATVQVKGQGTADDQLKAAANGPFRREQVVGCLMCLIVRKRTSRWNVCMVSPLRAIAGQCRTVHSPVTTISRAQKQQPSVEKK